MTTLQPDTLIKNPHGCHVASSVDVPADALKVWEVVGNFAGFDQFIPALSHIEMTGEGVSSLRKKVFKDGNLVVEQLNSRDDQALSMTWTTIYNTLGVASLWAAMNVESLGAGKSRATWTIIAEPAQGGAEALPGFKDFVQGFADDAMNNVQKLFA
ncbi:MULTISPECIES: SRPBCC family protein [unclassified Pseudomonas]|uniref:SRPBCC family protein n=1 Tax=unclassified Pseudomonas TaxID=196821 RepID=UPI001914123A|nr:MULTISPECIES: SRPBCC family protein [unclassified Pseudomonas]MBK5550530.1 SRPBCC family protein [Pseudomonas sp. TH03]MEB0228524.1 SRPBCC family protein [Pseudomonas sp. 5S1]MEB0298585.1 SRPBCC family protein [Pseudomonas sp. 10S4]WPX20046.1 SRPBCC family protein [Pseudomonas sp. 10S4]